MRQIKFRAWMESEQRMVEWPELIGMGTGLADVLTGVYLKSCMQFTGLLDSKGVEIYEGDIIEIGDGWPQNTNRYTITFKDGAFYAKGRVLSAWLHDAERNSGEKEIEIIGNIHTDAHLLESAA